MGDKRNYAALDWVIGEIGETLKEARQSLEAYVEDPRDTARIRFCLTHIHQVHGSLQMVEFHGASLFAEEMEALAEAIMNGQVTNDKEAHEALMRSLLQLPMYLDQVKTHHEDHAGIVLPLLNDLRAVRKQSYLSETNLFNPDLSSLSQIRGERHAILQDHNKLKQVFHKLREMYQYAAASVLRGIKIDENLAYIEKVFSRIEGITRGTASHPMWQVSAALIEALVHDDVELSIAVRGLMRNLARELKILEEHCPAALDAPPRESLLRNLLYYVARSEDSGPRVTQVKLQYGLENAILGVSSDRGQMNKGMVSPPEPDAVKAVVLALQDELNTCKHLLDLALSGQGGMSDLEEMLPYVKRISDTLAVLGIGDLRKQTQVQLEALGRICRVGEFSDGALIDIASGLANLENRLEAIAKGAGKTRDYTKVDEREIEIDAAKEAVLAECRTGLESVKDAIVESMSSQWDPSHLPAAVDTLHYVHGGLNMVPLPRPAAVLEACGQFIQNNLLEASFSPTQELQTLAEAIASIDYFIERLQGGHGDDLDIYLDMAEGSLAQLGFNLADDEDGEEADETESEQADVAPLEPTFHDDQSEAENSFGNESDFAIAEVEPEPLSGPDLAQPSAASGGSAESNEESEIDEEIIEIFIEEADEVLSTLAEYFPKWRDDMTDDESLGVIRRAFHTLKGSGRMVEAFAVGELAWSIENMLNRILDRTVKPQDAQAVLIGQVLDFIPALVDAFKNQEPNPNPTAHTQYITWAEHLAAGRVPEGLSGTGSYQDFTPPADEAADEVVVEDSAEDEDQALWEIFASEANTHLQVVDLFIADMDTAAPLFTTPTDHLQRALHTLKGSAHMAAVTPIASMITPLEGFVKELRGYQLRINDDILQLIKDASSYTRQGLECIDRKEPVEIPKLDQFVARVDELYERHIAPLIHMREQGTMPEGQKADPSLLTAFMSEQMDLLLDADRLVEQWRGENAITPTMVVDIYAELRQLDTVAGQANLPELQALAQLVGEVYAAIDAGQIELSDDLLNALAAAHETLLDMCDQVAAGMTVLPASTELLMQLHSFVAAEQTAPEESPEYQNFEFESSEDSFAAEDFDVASEDSHVGFDVATDFIGEGFSEEEIAAAHEDNEDQPAEVVGSAADRMAPVSEPANEDEEEPSETLPLETHEREPETEQSSSNDEGLTESVENADTPWTANVTEFEEQSDKEPEEWAQSEIAEPDEPLEPQLYESNNDAIETAAEDDLEQPSITAAEPGAREGNNEANDESESQSATSGFTAVAEDHIAYIAEDDFDPDILEIFLEEASELIEEMDEAIHNWESDWDDRDAPETMKRALHTLKGGARLSGLKNLGELTHNYESFLIGTRDPQATEGFFPTIHSYQDNVLNGVRGVRARLDGDPMPATPVIAQPIHEPTTDQTLGDEPEAENESVDESDSTSETTSAQIVPFQRSSALPEVDEDGGFLSPAQPAAKAPTATNNKRQGPQEMIKVSAELLEELVNLAGETSISRGRLEQQVSDLSSAVDEVDGTLRRLNEQLRRLDMETEAQVLFRQEQMAAHEGFDPLEMDRYSQLQQLTRSLMESASDLGDLKITLSDKIKDTETLLLQQSRINSALQEGLMRSRMVPFSRLVPRLRRIVRQVSGELGKSVNFELDNVEGEMDRSVLERMVAPLEHMLRNAVDHGIEMPAQRLAASKPETGRILLSLAREGGDILLRMADDRSGINLDRVREKAIERRLMAADAELSDHDIMQFILQAGFSTAENVTQISGRGVGMDVVAAEIKQLGGSIVIDSKMGVGTQFTVRLPFTVSVNRALMVQLGADIYAIPLNTIEGIVRVSPFELEHYYNHPDARFEYAGENYQVRHLASMLSADVQISLEGQVLPLPVILVRSAQHTMALQVDSLMGSREIVVKSLGAQFAAVQGLSGATVMGDGSVVVILDPHALVRREVAKSAIPAPAKTLQKPVESAPELRTIMVVDDSVTVRKVTTRFLEREGFNVVTAKDGVDALQLLQEEIPDLMLLDIEMPRMDGFEVAKNIRSSSRLKHLPIIMITSRTGDKHRQHALSIGVNDYMGKPYQEEALLKTM